VNGVNWKTDIELTNTQSRETTVSLVLPNAPDQPAMITTIGPHDTVRFHDIVAEAFGMDGVLSPLIVSTLGRRSVSINAVGYGVRGTEVFRPVPIAVSYADTYFPIRVLPGLAFNDDFRTNVGFANMSDQPATFTIALQRIPGRNVAVTRLTIPPSTLWHVAIQFLFPLITQGEDFTVLAETSSHNTYVYANVVDNATNSVVYVSPAVGTPNALGAAP
jgi:hypothetical protein